MRPGTVLLAFASAAFAAGPALMPMPVSVQPAAGHFLIDSNFVVETVGGANARLAPAVQAFLDRVSRQTGIMYAPVPPPPAEAHRLVIECAGGPEYPTLARRRILRPGCFRLRVRASTPPPPKAPSTDWPRSRN